MKSKALIQNALGFLVSAGLLCKVIYQLSQGRVIRRADALATVQEDPAIFWLIVILEIAIGGLILFFVVCSVFNLLPDLMVRIEHHAERLNRFSLYRWLNRK